VSHFYLCISGPPAAESSKAHRKFARHPIAAGQQSKENPRKCGEASIGATQQTEENLTESTISYIFCGSFATIHKSCTQAVQAVIGKT
jgi:hypothetical protein